MSNPSDIKQPLSRPVIRPTVGAVIGAVLTLVVIPAALVIAAVYPALNGRGIAVAAGMVIGAIGLAVTLATVCLYRLRLPNSNDAWVFW